jgi:hypothetical protein
MQRNCSSSNLPKAKHLFGLRIVVPVLLLMLQLKINFEIFIRFKKLFNPKIKRSKTYKPIIKNKNKIYKPKYEKKL